MTQFSLRPFLEILDKGSLFRTLFFFLFRLSAVILGLSALATAITTLSMMSNLGLGSVLGLVPGLLLGLLGTAIAIHVLWIRADAFQTIGEGDFVVTPLFAKMVRFMGEAAACALPVLFCGFACTAWFSSRSVGPDSFMPLASSFGGSSFISGLLMIVMGVGMGLSILIFSRFISEQILALADIASNIRELRESKR